MIKIIKIPKDRINVLKSCSEEIKKKIEVDIKTDENVIEIEGEPLNVWKAKDIVIAIGRGFSPINSFQLLEEGKSLEVIDLKNILKTKKNIKRIKGRIIGKEGKSRENIEEITNSNISVYGKTVSIIANQEDIAKIKNGIEMIINGVRHTKVYSYLRG